ncbi:cytosolic carboxypeptidase 2 [Ctenodactylus gundi]
MASSEGASSPPRPPAPGQPLLPRCSSEQVQLRRRLHILPGFASPVPAWHPGHLPPLRWEFAHSGQVEAKRGRPRWRSEGNESPARNLQWPTPSGEAGLPGSARRSPPPASGARLLGDPGLRAAVALQRVPPPAAAASSPGVPRADRAGPGPHPASPASQVSLHSPSCPEETARARPAPCHWAGTATAFGVTLTLAAVPRRSDMFPAALETELRQVGTRLSSGPVRSPVAPKPIAHVSSASGQIGGGRRFPEGTYPTPQSFLSQTLPDAYADFMHRPLWYYGYFKDSQGLSSHLHRSRQLLYDEQNGGRPHLRQPGELFTCFSSQATLQAPRWPVECEVIKEDVRHIEWVPPLPEYFYQPTGDEEAPEIAGDGSGTVVYELDSVSPEGSFFTSSRVGGKRGLVQKAAVLLQGPEDDTLLFESRFESGNLQKAVRVGAHEYQLTLRTDLYTNKHTQWFYFRVQNTRKDVTYRFTIVNLLKARSLYSAGMKPLLYSQRDAAARSIGWRREGGDVRYYPRPAAGGRRPAYCLTWTVRFPHSRDTCFLAHSYPYTYSDLQRYLLSVASDPARGRVCKLRPLCRSLAGNTVHLLTITNPSRTPQEAAAKRAVVLSARVHPGESNSSWAMHGFLDFVLSDAPDAQLLRDVFVFKVVPMVNPDGVIVGNHRCSLAGRDLNRHYGTALKGAFPCVWHTWTMVRRLLEEREVLLYCDFHGHSRKNNVFAYGCSRRGRQHGLHERVFPLMLSKNAPDTFSFRSCNFKVQKCREGTGRVVMWRMGVLHSYTLESTFAGSTLGSKRNTHFNTEDLKSLGHHVCDTLLDFCDPDPTKFAQCLAELEALLQQDVCKKLSELGQGRDLEASWNDVCFSDIESSTSGSDSSLSDGLPAHFLSPAAKVNQKPKTFKKKKKKLLPSRKQRNEQYQKNTLMRKFQLTETPRARLGGGDRGAAPDAPVPTRSPAKRKEKMQSEKLTAPRRHAPSSREPRASGQRWWPGRRARPAPAAYPALHISTYP